MANAMEVAWEAGGSGKAVDFATPKRGFVWLSYLMVPIPGCMRVVRVVVGFFVVCRRIAGFRGIFKGLGNTSRDALHGNHNGSRFPIDQDRWVTFGALEAHWLAL